MTRQEISEAVKKELDHAYSKHGRGQWGRHEFFGIVKEEFDEAWDAIKGDLSFKQLEREIIQIVAVCVRYLETGDRYGFDKK